MVLVDTSVLVSHLRRGNSRLQELLEEGAVVSHPFVVGELACGSIGNRSEIISLMQALPMLNVVEHEELLLFIEKNQVMGKGLGFVDVHLLAGAILAGVPLWTQDRKLRQACSRLGVDFTTQ
ncbi:MAG TPA: type II toxin-antitoxin system VapC family toxin [Phycisphaerales bacterium]|nr:type II toxin-antitoxin system VapC family toxin [Phycisphaerales bacterium]